MVFNVNQFLNLAIKFCKVHHFADDTKIVHFSKSFNKFNKYINTGKTLSF